MQELFLAGFNFVAVTQSDNTGAQLLFYIKSIR